MPVSNACNGSNPQFSSASSFLPGQNVTFTCSRADDNIVWYSSQFEVPPGAVWLSHVFQSTYQTRLDGAMIFRLHQIMYNPNQCLTSTATVANIQETMQGVSLSCAYEDDGRTIVIDVVGKLYVVPKVMLLLLSLVNNYIVYLLLCYIVGLGSEWIGQPHMNE